MGAKLKKKLNSATMSRCLSSTLQRFGRAMSQYYDETKNQKISKVSECCICTTYQRYSLPEHDVISDDLWIKIAEHLDGPSLCILSRVDQRCRSIIQLEIIWQAAVKSLKIFYEDPTISVVMRDSASWRALYWALRHETMSSSSIIMPTRLHVPLCAGLVISNSCIEFTGPIGRDRAVRAQDAWIVPAARSKCPLIMKRGYSWRVPPLLVNCTNSPRCAQYVFAPCRYFEVSISEPRVYCRGDSEDEPSWCVAVGLSTDEFPLDGMQPGWDARSCAYHSDDGHVFYGNVRIMALPRFGAGDTVGCGLRADGRLFFTLNGTLLGVAPPLPASAWASARRRRQRVLHPTVGVDSRCPLRINCGRSPFACSAAELGRACADAGGGGGSDCQKRQRPSGGAEWGRGGAEGGGADMLFDCGCAVS